VVAIANNIAFISYGALAEISRCCFCVVLLPVNMLRLRISPVGAATSCRGEELRRGARTRAAPLTDDAEPANALRCRPDTAQADPASDKLQLSNDRGDMMAMAAIPSALGRVLCSRRLSVLANEPQAPTSASPQFVEYSTNSGKLVAPPQIQVRVRICCTQCAPNLLPSAVAKQVRWHETASFQRNAGAGSMRILFITSAHNIRPATSDSAQRARSCRFGRLGHK
jgi:hypothetical protein